MGIGDEVIVISSDEESRENEGNDMTEESWSERSQSSWGWESSDNSGSGQTESETGGSSWESGLSDVSLGGEDVFYSGAEGGDEHERRGLKRKCSSD